MAETLNTLTDFILFPGATEATTEAAAISFDMSGSLRQENMFAPYGFDSTYHPFSSSSPSSSYTAVPAYPAVDAMFFAQPMVEGASGYRGGRGFTPSASPSVSFYSSSMEPSYSTAASGPSASSSAVGSPYANAVQPRERWTEAQYGLGLMPDLIHAADLFSSSSSSSSFREPYNLLPDSGLDYVEHVDYDGGKHLASFIDPTLIQPVDRQFAQYHPLSSVYRDGQAFAAPPTRFQPPSPAPSDASSRASQGMGTQGFQAGTRHPSPYLYRPYPPAERTMRRPSVGSVRSHDSPRSAASLGFDEDGKERGRCPHSDCGRTVRDLKAHMLTHQAERPEKCPIATCDYHIKGFARKYDRCRHTLTHYKGTMVCGFCPNSGSAAEKSFNRADVFKRHLTSVHGVEQSPPNGRRRNGPAAPPSRAGERHEGRCSTCSTVFGSAQEFYDHLDDCVLKILERPEPSEAINQRHLVDAAGDGPVVVVGEPTPTQRHVLAARKHDTARAGGGYDDGDDYGDGRQVDHPGPVSAIDSPDDARSGRGSIVGSHGQGPSQQPARARGMTHSRGGVALAGKGRRKRRHHPHSWGCPQDQMTVKKRVLCVFDGSRRLWKDEMVLDREFEVRIPLAGGDSYVTDLDVATLTRAEALHGATEEEKGPVPHDEIERLMM